MSEVDETIDSQLINDPEMVECFIAEAKEHLDAVEDDFLSLEKQKDAPDRALLDKVFRAIHSVKGAAGFLGLATMTRLSHVMETLLSRMRSGEIRPESEYIDALLAGVDLLTTMLEDIEQCNAVDITHVHDQLNRLLEMGPDPGHPLKPLPAEVETDPGKKIYAADKTCVDFGSTVRIHVDLLDKLMVQAGELVLVRNQHLLSVDESNAVSRSIAHRLDLVTSELQETIIATRMQPIGKIIGKFPRIVRELGKNLGKQIQISITGSEAELDKTILESLTDPLTHIIRNCCGHGIETPGERVRAGKPKTGQITLAAYHEAGRVSVEIRDDGRGIDPELIRKKVLEKGLKTESELEQLSDKEILYLIFLPGFSTAEQASDVSGRGVGMDVVKTGIEKLGGSFDLESTVGEGTRILLRLPLTLAIIPSLLVTSGNNLYAIPQVSLVELVCLYDSDVRTKIECAHDQEVYRLRDRLLPLVRLSEVLERPERFSRKTRSAIAEKYQRENEVASKTGIDDKNRTRAGKSDSMSFVVLKAGNSRYGMIVDQILGTEEIVVKPMHWAVKSLGIYSGATIMGNGKGALILDVEGIARHTGIILDMDTAAEETARGLRDDELQTVLLFTSGEKEQFAMALPLIRRIEPISMSDIEQVGDKEYITIDNTSTLVLRLDKALKVTPVVEREEMYLILPRHIKRSVGILISDLIDIEETAVELDVDSYPEDGLLGTDIIRGSMTLFVDIYRLVERIEPEWFADRRMNLFGTTGPPSESAKNILLLEDISFLRHLVKGYLEADGYRVVTAENGRVGLDRMDEMEFDLIVSDLEMPEMNGWDFVKHVRQSAHQQDIPTLALTALDSDKDRERARECGFDRYEIKIDRERFLTAVAELLAPGKNE
ncbi:MAG: hybrid sensor histidine kinase/response regulator [Pseudomonadota bacterium]